MTPVAFRKVEGLGNDFILLDFRGRPRRKVATELVRLRTVAPSLCDRRLGIGADGILVVADPQGRADAAMLVINADGSRPQMCGNGLRCVALVVAGAPGTNVLIETDAGPRLCAVTREHDDAGWVDVDMGPAYHDGVVEPRAGVGRCFARVSMGNPHAVAFVAADEDAEGLARTLGPQIENDPLFAEGTNVEFARVTDSGAITLWVWERGCGITDACGTGACATAAAAVAQGLRPSDTPIEVRLPGGALTIVVPADDGAGVRMGGPARVVYRGEIDLASRG